ncbi:ABC transporter permease [Paenibacillus cymbidii]|uniref:ABC transporter permease n=1 Tax=Paenibacillus cymbidii TaxID=1639034 RepID=UPI00108097E4|nr:ABC transporter permease subunit [Paenibacillus cymbidii]
MIALRKRALLRAVRSNAVLFGLTVPALLYFLIFHYLPMVGVVLAFKDYKYSLGILGSEWIGFTNFKFFFTSQDAWRITRNTVGYSSAFIVLGNAAAIFVALLLYEVRSRAALKYYQTTMILPRFLSWVLVAYISYTLLSPTMGIFNQALEGLGFEPVTWYSEAKVWPYLIIGFEMWKTVGLSSIIYYAALMSIDSELFEAARMDGANRWRQVWAISIPSLTPVMTILVILAIGGLFRGDFGLFYQLPRDVGALYPTTDIIDTYVYRGLRNGDIGMTAAVGLFQSVVGLVLILIANGIIRKVKPENAIF